MALERLSDALNIVLYLLKDLYTLWNDIKILELKL